MANANRQTATPTMLLRIAARQTAARALPCSRRVSTVADQAQPQEREPPRVTIEKRPDNIAVVSLNRPSKYNALDMAMFEGICNAATELRQDRSIRAVILKGEGKVFCAGLDVKSVASNPLNFGKLLKRPEGRVANMAQDVGFLWRTLSVPVIAACRGICFGGGLQIALGADFRIATPDCQFSIMESKWGLIPDMSAAVTLRHLVSLDVAKELTFTGRIITGTEAHRLGLVTRVSPDPFEEAVALAREISVRSPDSVAAAKLLFDTTWGNANDAEALALETELQKMVLGRWNQLAASAAALSGKPPRYIRRKRVWDRKLWR